MNISEYSKLVNIDRYAKSGSYNKSPTEHQECLSFVSWLDYMVMSGKVVCYSHIPQETFTKSWGTKIKNKQEGVHSGVPDYVVVLKDKIVWCEMKREKGGVVSDDQKRWIGAINAAGGYADVCKGADQAIKFIESLI